MTLSEITTIIQDKTSKTVLSSAAVILYSGDLLELNDRENTNNVYVGRLQITDNQTGYFRWKIGEAEIVTMPLNQTDIYKVNKCYEDLIFTSFVSESLSEDTEIVFSGYKIVLQ